MHGVRECVVDGELDRAGVGGGIDLDHHHVDRIARPEARLVQVRIVGDHRRRIGRLIGVIVAAHDVEGPIAGAVRLRLGRLQNDAVADLPPVALHYDGADNCSGAMALQRLDLLLGDFHLVIDREERPGVDSEGEDVLIRFLVTAAEVCPRRHHPDAGNGPHPLDHSQWHGVAHADAAADVQAVAVGLRDRLLDPGIQTLQQAEQQESRGDLQQHQDGATGLAPDARPHERQVLHCSDSP